MNKSENSYTKAVVALNAEMQLTDLCHEIAEQQPREVVLELIKELDLAISDWEFTEELSKYFGNETKKLEKEDEQST